MLTFPQYFEKNGASKYHKDDIEVFEKIIQLNQPATKEEAKKLAKTLSEEKKQNFKQYTKERDASHANYLIYLEQERSLLVKDIAQLDQRKNDILNQYGIQLGQRLPTYTSTSVAQNNNNNNNNNNNAARSTYK